MADYATLAELKARLEKTLPDDDTVLSALITAASRAIDAFCNRPDGFVAPTIATARVYAGSGRAWQRIDECVEITLVEVKESATDDGYVAWTGADWIAFSGDPEQPDFNRTPYTAILCAAGGAYSVFTSGFMTQHGVPTVRVTAKWGYAVTVPPAIREACVIQAARWWKRGQSAWADTAGTPELGLLLYRRELDPDLKMILVTGRYVRPVI